jgi:membrane-bound lytic murein transglycosylase MltF
MSLSGNIAVVLAFSFVPGAMAESLSAPASPTDSPPRRRLATQPNPWTGDFDQMLERRYFRVLVPYSRSLYFNDKGFERGLSAESVRGFEKWLNQKYAKQLKNRPITVLIGPRTRDRLLPDVAAGLADIAVGNLTITPERLEVVDFVPFRNLPPVNEVVVTGKAATPVAAVGELAGRTVHVRRASSYFESLTALNQRFGAEGKPAVHVVLVPDALEDEDLLEMLDAGIVEAIVVDDWKAKMWAQILPDIRINEQAVLRTGSQIGWAIRRDSPKLEAEILGFMNAEAKKGIIAWHIGQAMRRVRRLKNPNDTAGRKKFEQVYALFEKYGEKYHFDPLMLTAQGFQESRLNQNARSPVGAVGVMQVMPATGNELKVGDIHQTEPNVHAGAKYMDRLMTKFFSDAAFDDANRTLFAFASYNAGPGAIARMRREARKVGLDPDQWFNNVEIVTARRIGAETTTYVRNIYKYYAAYKLLEEARAEARRAREQVGPVFPPQ